MSGHTAMGYVARLAALAVIGTGAAAAGFLGLVTGALPLDVGVGRRTRPLGPQVVDIEAPRDVVFDVVAEPYLGRSTRAMREKIRVLERGTDMVLAAHDTPVGARLTATTVETPCLCRRAGHRSVAARGTLGADRRPALGEHGCHLARVG